MKQFYPDLKLNGSLEQHEFRFGNVLGKFFGTLYDLLDHCTTIQKSTVVLCFIHS
jgi:hypothetical protein